MRQRLALCAGLNYPGTSAELAGCVNDAEDWAAVLRQRGYEAVVQYEPTKQAIVAQLEDMIERCRFGDRFVFTYSGHGSWIPDMDGDEPDGRDEVVCPADFAQGNVLSDDELFAIFGEARFGVRRLIVSDSCHSGSVARYAALSFMRASRVVAGVPRYIPPSEFLDPEMLERARRAPRVVRGAPRKGTVLMSGCGDLEYSYDATFEGRPNGAFTRAAIDALAPDLTVKRWHKRIRSLLPSTLYPQSPQLSALPHQRYWTPL